MNTKLSNGDIRAFLERVKSQPYNNELHAQASIYIDSILRFFIDNNNVSKLLPYIRSLVELYYNSSRNMGNDIDNFPAEVMGGWFNLGPYNDEVIDATNTAIYDTLLISYSPEEAIDIIKRANTKLTMGKSPNAVNSKLADKLLYRLPYGSFADQAEVNEYRDMETQQLKDKYNTAVIKQQQYNSSVAQPRGYMRNAMTNRRVGITGRSVIGNGPQQ